MAILWLAKRHKTITAEPDLAMMRAGFAGTEANMKRLDVLAYVLVALIGASAVASGQCFLVVLPTTDDEQISNQAAIGRWGSD